MAFLRRLLFTAAALAASACDFSRRPTPIEVTAARPSVFAMLMTGSRSVTVRLATVAASAEVPEGVESQPISGATVFLLAWGDSVRLAQATSFKPECVAVDAYEPADTAAVQPGCYAAELPVPVQAGERYVLHVRFPEGGSAEGVAVPPATPTLLSPSVGQRIQAGDGMIGSRDTRMRLAWSAGADAAAWQYGITVVGAFRGNSLVPGAHCTTFGLLFSTQGAARETSAAAAVLCQVHTDSLSWQQLAWDSLRVRVTLAVYDTTYARFARVVQNGVAPEAAGSAGVRGALGVFGGGAVADVPVVFVR